MFDLVAHLKLAPGPDAPSVVTVLQEAGADSAFLPPLLAHAGLSTLGRAVMVISTQQVFLHYALVCRKLGGGVQLMQMPPSQFAFVDALSHLHDHDGDDDDKWAVTPDPTRPTVGYLRGSIGSDSADAVPPNAQPHLLPALVDHVRDTLANRFAGAPALVIVDDWMPLLYTGCCSAVELVSAIRQLRRLMEQTGSVMVTPATPDLADPAGDAAVLARGSADVADTMLVCRGLSTGYSRDVHGQMSVVRGRHRLAAAHLSNGPVVDRGPEPVTLQFKVVDKGVEFFGSGLASAVV
ncbi:hypothetical protein BC828DRAFT_389663 [Blastocladiella britannica]|nr:hypothetical protein BC828DRAFT_389663 [Blastocladiella britannica]